MKAWGRANFIGSFSNAANHRTGHPSRCHLQQHQDAPAKNSFGIPTGFSKRTPALVVGLIALAALGGVGFAVAPLLADREPILSPRKTLAMIAARAEQAVATPVEQTRIVPIAVETVAPPVEPELAATETPEPADDFPFSGVWAVNEKACMPQLDRQGYLPTIISDQGAWAGETTCAFRSSKQEGDAVIVSASCSDPHKRWRSQVRLSVVDGRLIWKSQSGTRSYVRCEPGQARTRIAEATTASR
jgi:hypothetical protein